MNIVLDSVSFFGRASNNRISRPLFYWVLSNDRILARTKHSVKSGLVMTGLWLLSMLYSILTAFLLLFAIVIFELLFTILWIIKVIVKGNKLSNLSDTYSQLNKSRKVLIGAKKAASIDISDLPLLFKIAFWGLTLSKIYLNYSIERVILKINHLEFSLAAQLPVDDIVISGWESRSASEVYNGRSGLYDFVI